MSSSSAESKIRCPRTARSGRPDRLERASGEVGGEDDVDDVLSDEQALRGDRVDDGDGSFERQILPHADLLAELPPQRFDKALAAVDAAAGQQPVLPAARFLVPAQEDASLPAEERGDADTRLERHQADELPKPFSPRSVSGSSATSTGSGVATGTTTSCAIRIPGSTTNVSAGSVLRRMILSSPR